MSNIFEQFGDFLGGAFKPSTEQIEAKTTELPQTGYSFVSPYAEDYSRRLLSAYFGDLRGIQGLPLSCEIYPTRHRWFRSIRNRQENSLVN